MLAARSRVDASLSDRPEGAKSRAVVIAAVVLLVVVVVIGVVVGVFGSGGKDSPEGAPQQAAPPASAPSASTSGAPRPSASPTAELVTEPLTKAPEGVTWTTFQGVALPFSDEAGPTRIDGPVYAGYEHSP